MTTKHTGGPEFPVADMGTHGNYGMTLRDYFAAKALEGICASSPGVEWTDLRIARDAYALADAMLKVREEAWKLY